MASSIKALTVAGDNQKLIIIAQLVHDNVGVGSNNLLLGRKFSALLELKVTNGTREGEVAVDTAEINKTASSSDACFLSCR